MFFIFMIILNYKQSTTTLINSMYFTKANHFYLIFNQQFHNLFYFGFIFDKQNNITKMKNLKKYKNELYDKFKFCFIQGDPQTLTITKNPSEIQADIYTIPICIWIVDKNKQVTIPQKDIKQKVGRKVHFVKSIKESEQIINGSKISILICSQSVIEEAESVFEQNIKEKNIHIICFGSKISNKNNKIIEVDSEKKTIEQIKKIQVNHRKQNEFVNFVSLSNQINDSNLLINLILSMVSQQTCTYELMNEFKKLALICNDGSNTEYSQNKQNTSFSSVNFIFTSIKLVT